MSGIGCGENKGFLFGVEVMVDDEDNGLLVLDVDIYVEIELFEVIIVRIEGKLW